MKLAGRLGKILTMNSDPLDDEHGGRFVFQKDEWVPLEESRAYGSASELLLDLDVLGEPLEVQRVAISKWLALQAARRLSVAMLLIEDLKERQLLPDGADAESPRTHGTGEVVIDLRPSPGVPATGSVED